MAEGLMRQFLQGRRDITVLSAGVHAQRGGRASHQAVTALEEEGISLDSFRSQPITEELLDRCTHVFTMTREHQHLLNLFFPEYESRIRVLGEFTESGGDVPDPIGQSVAVYKRCRDVIKAALAQILDFVDQSTPLKNAMPTTQRPASSLAETDPQIADAIAAEHHRQLEHIELIASENFTSAAVMEAQGSCLTNKYAEGYPGRRWYGGCEYVDSVELLAIAARRNSLERIMPMCSHTAVVRPTWLSTSACCSPETKY